MRIEHNSTISFYDQEIKAYTISNGSIELTVCTLGCTITSLFVPGTKDIKKNIIVGYDSISAYMDDIFYTGSTIGRVAGRISNASFTIDGQLYRLTQNETGTTNHLHGGKIGFNKKNFRAVSESKSEKEASIMFYYRSKDMEEGYPGNLDVWIRYTVTEQNKIIIGYRAITDKKTHVNLTNHTYFNLTGRAESANGHELCINADAYIPADDHYIPTGDILTVGNSKFDFRKRRKIKENPDQPDILYNECFVLNKKLSTESPDAVLYHSGSGISMSVTTTLPGILLYTGDFLSAPFIKNQGICLEAMYFPDTPNNDQFPSTLLLPDDEYLHSIAFAFNCIN